MNQPIWVLVNCNTIKEAKKIGDGVLNRRLGSCFDIFPRELTIYFWPPKANKLESAKGALLVVETFEDKYQQVQKLVKKLHSDKLPFIGYIDIKGTQAVYQDWMKGEIS